MKDIPLQREENADAYNNLGVHYTDIGNIQKAEACFRVEIRLREDI